MEFKYLCITLDRRLTWSLHLKEKCKKLNFRFHLLKPLLRSNLNIPIKIILYLTLLQPLWAYRIINWGSAKKSNKRTKQAFSKYLSFLKHWRSLVRLKRVIILHRYIIQLNSLLPIPTV